MKTNGIGFLSVLTLIFITLKLCGVITWSWWWVVAPMWAPPGMLLLAAAGLGVGWAMCWVLDGTDKYRRKRRGRKQGGQS